MIKKYYLTFFIAILFLLDFVDGIFSTQGSFKILGFINVESKAIFLLYKLLFATVLFLLGFQEYKKGKKGNI